MMVIREAGPGDVEALHHLMKELGGREVTSDQMMDRLEFVEESKSDSLFVCEEGGDILGLLGFRIRENLEEVSRFGEISAIVVKPEHRRRGIGSLMMDFAEKLAKDNGCLGTWLVSGFGKEAESHPFYNRFGYEINGYRFVKLFR
jgi:GNAT superfamily N-acetyltransferase